MIRYDKELRRLWIKGQRWHHGTTGVFLAATGLLLMAHDWKDRGLWFVRGDQFSLSGHRSAAKPR